MLGLIGFLDGLTALLIIVFGIIFAISILIKSKKLGAKLLKWGALMGLFSVLLWLGPTLDFISVITTGKNLSPIWVYGILSYMFVGPAIMVAIYLGAELLLPEKKKLVLIIFLIISVIFEILLFIDTPNSFTFTLNNPGEELIDARFNYGHPTFFLIAIILLSLLLLNGIGSLRKAIQSTGIVRKKFVELSIVFFLFVIVAAFDAFLTPGIILFIVRMGMIICAILIYEALKP